MPVTLSVRTLDFAKLALKTRIHDRLSFSRLDPSYISVVLVIKKRKERRERIAIFEAKPAALTDLECPLDLFVESGFISVFFFGRIVGQSISGFVTNAFFVCRHLENSNTNSEHSGGPDGRPSEGAPRFLFELELVGRGAH